MNRSNALTGLIGNYGDSDDESDNGERASASGVQNASRYDSGHAPATVHPAPIPQCVWSACYDESSGFTYYWNQQTNAVTWEAPPEYLMALKIAQQQLNASRSTEVTAEEWKLYQQALAEKQNSRSISKPPAPNKMLKMPDKSVNKNANKRSHSDDEEKIELITSYHNSDSDSNDEPDSPIKAPKKQKPIQPQPKTPKPIHKKAKTKALEYGPVLPPSLNYNVPIGPEMPPELAKPVSSKEKEVNGTSKLKKPSKVELEEENAILMKLKDKAKILEKLGGELPSGLEKIIGSSAKTIDEIKPTEIDDLLEEIEKKELPKAKTKRIDNLDEDSKCSVDSNRNSPVSGVATPETKPLFPSAVNESPSTNTEEAVKETKDTKTTEKKATNLYLPDPNEQIENINRKKLRISNSVLPERKIETPSYTTKYSQHIDGFSGERTGLGFSQNDNEEAADSPKNTISYGNGLTFTKGETLNEGKVDEDESEADDLDLIEAKVKHLLELQPVSLTPVQRMLLQLETLGAGVRAGAVCARYWREAVRALRRLERAAAPPGWTPAFHRSEGRYKYVRESDNFEQWEYPIVDTDMDISTTPPHPSSEPEDVRSPEAPPPPLWEDPPPPGCDDPPALPQKTREPKIGDELLSFYNDIAELEKKSSNPNTASNSPERTPDIVGNPIKIDREKEDKEREKEREREREREKERDRVARKKNKLKISSGMGLKHKTVSNMVAKWQQVAEEINSD